MIFVNSYFAINAKQSAGLKNGQPSGGHTAVFA